MKWNFLGQLSLDFCHRLRSKSSPRAWGQIRRSILQVVCQASMAVALLGSCSGPCTAQESVRAKAENTTPSNRDKNYDPLTVDRDSKVAIEDMDVADLKRERQIPVRVYLPSDTTPCPIVLFSHGLGGSRNGNRYLGEHLAGRGYVVVVLQHQGSDMGVWRNVSPRERMQVLKQAASAENLFLRVVDVTAVLDQLTIWNQDRKHLLYGRLDLGHVGMSGHSFGAHTTQGASGQSFPLVQKKYTDPRILAALAYSPSAPEAGNHAQAFSQVSIPWMLMTGTEDVAPIGAKDVATRLAVFDNLPKTIDRYQLVLDQAQHSAFTDGVRLGEDRRRNPNHHRSILAMSTAFWDAYLRDNSSAKEWLMSSAAREILDPADRWDAISASSSK